MFRKKEHPPSKKSKQSSKVNKTNEASDKFGLSLKLTNGEPQIIISFKIGLVTLGVGVLWLVRKTVLLQVGIIIGGLSILFVICYGRIVRIQSERNENDNKIEENRENRQSNQKLKEIKEIGELECKKQEQKNRHEEIQRVLDIAEKNPQILPNVLDTLMNHNTVYNIEKKHEENKTEIISFSHNNEKERTK